MARTCVSGVLSHPGKLASTNDDTGFADDARRLYIVSDGVGSCRNAVVGSRAGVDAAVRAFDSSPSPDIRKTLAWATREANRRIQEEGRRSSPPQIMAATFTGLTVREEDFHIVHVGDSRAYLLREDRLVQITRDHSVAFEQYWAGAITREDIPHHPNQNVLTKTLGTSDFLIPDFMDGALRPGDIFLLCSDGLTKELDDLGIFSVLSRAPGPVEASRRLVDAANAVGGRDNITVVVVDVS